MTNDYGVWLDIKEGRQTHIIERIEVNGCCPSIQIFLADIATENSGTYTINSDTTIEQHEYLIIPYGSTCIVPTGITLTNAGTITNNGVLLSDGRIMNTGTLTSSHIFNSMSRVTNSGTITNTGILSNTPPGVLANTGRLNNIHSGSINNVSIIYNYGGGVIRTNIYFTNTGTINNAITGSPCGAGTLVGVTATGTACP